MKRILILVAAVTMIAGCAPKQNDKENTVTMIEQTTPNPENAAIAQQFLKKCGTYYLATVEGDQPRVRPFGTALIYEGKLYIQTGRRKNVAKQLIANGKCEICAMKGDEWIRISGVLIDDNRREPKAAMLDAHPSLKGMYSLDDDNTMVLYFQPGTVTSTIWSFSHDPIVMRF